MVTAAIAYADLATGDLDVIDRAGALLAKHPDRGAFEVASGRAVGEERTRRLMLECARWPDDARGTVYDHPSWHYAFRPVVRKAEPPARPPPDEIVGDAVEAFALNARVVANPLAPEADRAVSLCWLMHIAGDIHQPLHAAQLYSPLFGAGDRGATLAFVKDPRSGDAVSLHWFWDDAVHRSGEPDGVVARARELMDRLPRASMKDLRSRARVRDLAAWARDESHPLAASLAYRSDLELSASAATAVALDSEYVEAATQAAERRLTLSGYRLADVLREVLSGDPRP